MKQKIRLASAKIQVIQTQTKNDHQVNDKIEIRNKINESHFSHVSGGINSNKLEEETKLDERVKQYDLALKYKDGVGVDKDDNKAFELFKKSAEGGHLDGINMLGECYYNGIGTSIDRQMALELFQKAANFGSSAAEYNLGYIYMDGKTVEKDYDKSTEYFTRSIKGGYSNPDDAAFGLLIRALNISNEVGNVNLNKVHEDIDRVRQMADEASGSTESTN